MNDGRINFIEPKEFATPQKPQRVWRIFVMALVLAGVSSVGYIAWQERAPAVANAESVASGGDFEPSYHRIFRRLKAFITGDAAGLEGTRRDRINILLLGMGGPGHDGPYLTDTIIVASVKPSTNHAALLSIPRDLAAPIPGYGWYKINHANSFGEEEQPGNGGAFAAQVVEKTLDEPIDYYVRVDFTAFEQLIDEVGGVDIVVDRGFVDQNFPAGPNQYNTVSFNKGAQHMDGKTALMFARSRHGNNGEGSDFARAKRQQKTLMALRDKLLSLGTITNPARISRIIQTLREHITTNADVMEIVQLLSLAQSIEPKNIKQHVLTNAEDDLLMNATVNGAFLLQPRAGNYDEIHLFVNELLERAERVVPLAPDPKPPVSALRVGVYNGTWKTGFATRWQKWLEEQGFAVPVVGNTIERPLAKTQLILRDPDDKKKTAPLIDVFGVGLVTASSTPLIEETPSVSVIILLGDDSKEPY
ncbi:MAG: LCP family protein [Patescibacteria group bacterium]